MKWITSLDELLFEVVGWLIFFPLTLWRSLWRPLTMMAYADDQLTLPEAEQYSAAVSPPLFLALALLVARSVSGALGERDAIVANQHGLAAAIVDDTSAMILRLVIFAAFPLFAAVRVARRRGEPVDRATLRGPFYAQCYPLTVFALGLSLGADLMAVSPAVPYATGAKVAGAGLFAMSVLFYLIVETRYFATRLGIGPFRAAGAALFGLGEGIALLILAGFLLTR